MATIGQLIEQAVASRPCNDWHGTLSASEYLTLLDVGRMRVNQATRNDHLANPLNRDPDVHCDRPRSVPLTGEEAVYGDHLLLEFIGHRPLASLIDYDDLPLLEAAILSDFGIFSAFKTYQFAFIHFRIRPYRVTFKDSSGTRQTFDKSRQYEGIPYPKNEVFADRQILWDGT